MKYPLDLSLIKKIMTLVVESNGDLEITRNNVVQKLGCDWDTYRGCHQELVANHLVCENVSVMSDPKPISCLTLLGTLLYDSNLLENG